MTVTVDFTGICTHTRTSGGTHRIILVRADNGDKINSASIPPHYPYLQIKPRFISGIGGNLDGLQQLTPDTWRLCGVNLSMKGVTDESLVYDDTFGNVPHLDMPDAPDRRENLKVLTGNDAACYFDFTKGTLRSSKTRHGAHTASLALNTDTSRALEVTSFWNGSVSTIYLEDDAQIEIMHMGLQYGDTDKDFYLHYRIFEEIDASAVIPDEPKSRVQLPPGSISIGCSNSQYP
jgi:hypothetical protein